MIVLALSIVMVYILLFQVKGKTLQRSQTDTNSWADIAISIQSGDQEQTLTPIYQGVQGTIESDTGLTTDNTQITTGLTVLPTSTGLSTSSTPATTISTAIPQTGSIQILSGTNVFYGTIDIIEKLGIKYQYALIDTWNTYFIYLGNPSYDFATIARQLKGNLYELKTEQEIAQNKLFGDKIVFINLPEYKDKEVIMLIYLKDKVRLVQMEYKAYHKSKAYLKSLFIQ